MSKKNKLSTRKRLHDAELKKEREEKDKREAKMKKKAEKLKVNPGSSLAKQHKRGLKVGRQKQFRLAKPAEKRKQKALSAMDLD
ncbi:hypothetical protein KFL_001230050 [Klebsormidium nitens]|uniref:Uncharacterized protein n=1 Tax=Klebsormidium nitens TaxID=105231 RepID=A0A1Y1I1Y5_KLENI|nr:hypothetical protein KFL_001230050 [Klebsormidium nitens]|eukprot:GAQ82757.1 hypothetical protein KFL_001230050 [Klebsormidium nitens]